MPQPTEDDEEKATHRLERMTVAEVSLVDRAANKRRFLITKRNDPTMKPKPVKKDDAATGAANAADASTNAGDAPAAAASDDASAAGGMQQQVKELLMTALTGVGEKVIDIANAVDKIEGSDTPADPAVPAEITTQIADALSAFNDLAKKFAAGGDASASTDAAPASDAASTPDASAVTAAAKEDDEERKKEATPEEKAAVDAATIEIAAKGLAPATHADLVVKSVAARLRLPLEKAQTVIAKVGRRMAKKRLEQLSKAIDMLIGLMKELRYDSAKKALEAAAGKTPTNKAAAPEMPAEVTELLKTAESLVEISSTQASELATTKAALAKANGRIAELQKITTGSNALPVEKANQTPRALAWPMDMNSKTATR